MKPYINAITLGVEDLERAVHFYRDGLGLSTDGIIGTEFVGSASEPAGAVAMFTLDGSLILSLYPRSDLAKDASVDPRSFAGSAVSLGHAVPSREDVDALLAAAQRAGGTVTAPPHERPWGIYSGYFRDPDGHLWEVIHFLPGGSGDDPARQASQSAPRRPPTRRPRPHSACYSTTWRGGPPRSRPQEPAASYPRPSCRQGQP